MLVIFDCDGVLIDSERILNEVYRECLQEVGLELSLAEVIHAFKGRSSQDCLVIVEQMLGRAVSEQQLSHKYEELGAQRFQEEIGPIPGIKEVLEELPFRRCVASSSSHDHIRLGLERSGLLPYFTEGIYSASDVSRGKPAPDLFLHAASEMGVAPEECVVVEDSPAGVEGAVAAGMQALGFVDLTPASELQAAGAQTFHRMRELPGLIAQLSR
ncbi:HAD family hydrolase [bacterium]|nr:HAD family hydrolase [bacterium]